MTAKSDPSWVISLRHAADKTIQTMTVQNGTMVGALKAAQAELKNRTDGPWQITGVEAAPAAPNPPLAEVSHG